MSGVFYWFATLKHPDQEVDVEALLLKGEVPGTCRPAVHDQRQISEFRHELKLTVAIWQFANILMNEPGAFQSRL